eukprot:Em0014g737a
MYEEVDDDDSACEEVDDAGTEVACDLLEIPGNDGDRGPGDKVTIPSLTLTWSKGLHSASCSASEELNVLQSSLGRRHSKVIPSHAINTKDEDERVKAISANPSTAETYFVRAEVYEKGEVPPHSTSLTAEDGPQRHHGTQPQVQGPIQPGEDVAVLEWATTLKHYKTLLPSILSLLVPRPSTKELVCSEVKFRAQTDDVLRNFMEHAPKNGTYTSKMVQNDLIDICGDYDEPHQKHLGICEKRQHVPKARLEGLQHISAIG